MIESYSQVQLRSREDFNVATSFDIKCMRISLITGISESFIRTSLENGPENITDVDRIMDQFKKNYNFSDYINPEDILFFIVEISNISPAFLEYIRANDVEFFYGLSLEESLEILLTRLIDKYNDVPSSNGFPQDYNFQSEQQNNIQNLPNGRTWYPFINRFSNRNINYNSLKIDILNKCNVINTDNVRILYHGTSWAGARQIMAKVKSTSRGFATDFGMNNFYLTDIFYNACKWANRYTQGAVIIFSIPLEYFDEWNVKYLTGDEWKNVVYRCRNPPIPDFFPDIRDYRRADSSYNGFLNQLDSYDVVEGPIFANPRAQSINDVSYIVNSYDGSVPKQISFKRSSVDFLDDLILTTLFFKESRY